MKIVDSPNNMDDSHSEYPTRIFRGRKPSNSIEISFYKKIVYKYITDFYETDYEKCARV